MELQTLLSEQIEREYEYLEDQEVGSEEYNASMKRLNILEDKFIELEKFESETVAKSKQVQLDSKRLELETETKARLNEDEKKDKRIKNILEGVKIGTSIVMPIIGLVWITAAEKEITFCGALKGYASMFVPKKLI